MKYSLHMVMNIGNKNINPITLHIIRDQREQWVATLLNAQDVRGPL